MTANDLDLNERDPERRLAAAHELGHWFGFRAAGIGCTPPRVTGRGPSASGYVTTDTVVCETPSQIRAYIVAILAGRAAGQMWSELPDENARQSGGQCGIDETDVRHALRHRLAHGMTRAALYREAGQLVRRHWPQITRLVPRLARTGRITAREATAA
jgi:hypothetical protein